MPEASSALISEANSSQSPLRRVQYSGQMPKRSRASTIRASRPVPQGESELAAQMREQILLMVFPEMRDQFGIAVGGKAMAAAFSSARISG